HLLNEEARQEELLNAGTFCFLHGFEEADDPIALDQDDLALASLGEKPADLATVGLPFLRGRAVGPPERQLGLVRLSHFSHVRSSLAGRILLRQTREPQGDLPREQAVSPAARGNSS